MTHRKGFKRILSLICILCLVFPILGSQVFASSTEDTSDEEYVETQTIETDNELMEADSIDNDEILEFISPEKVEEETDQAGQTEVIQEEIESEPEDTIETEKTEESAGAEEDEEAIEAEESAETEDDEETVKDEETVEAVEEAAEIEETEKAEDPAEPKGLAGVLAALAAVPVLRAGGEPRAVDVEISNFHIESLLYETPESLYYNDSFYLSMDWDASALGTDIHEGDYFDITLPDNMRFPEGTTARDFTLKDDNGNIIANAHVTPGPGDAGGTVRITFTDAVENNYDVSGHLYLAARFNRALITTGEYNTFSITINSDVSGEPQTIETGVIITGPKELENEYIGKWGQAVYNQPNVAEWWVRLNHTKANLTNAVFTDTLGSSGESFIQDSFILREVVFDAFGNVLTATPIDTTGMLTFSDDGSSFVLNLGNINGTQYQLSYRSTYTPGSVLRNAANIHSEEIDRTFRATHVSAESGGSGSGSLASKIKIIKVDEDDVSVMLSNAVFEVTAPNGTTFTLTTGPDGTVTSGVLQQGVYRVREIQAPDGYEIIPEESEFTMEVTASGGAVHRVKNRKVSLIDIPVYKVWADANDQDGIRPLTITVKLLANEVDTGKTLELNAGNNWTDTFTDLDEYQNGRKVTYTVEEEDVTGYIGMVSGDAETGFTITNTHEPETTEITGSKTWDDNDDQDGMRPGEITIRLLQNGAEIDSRTVGEAENWSWTFADLPKYENGGNEITYSITEDAVSDYTPEYDGYNVTNRHTPGKTSVPVSKVWDDADDQDGIRPLTITVKLLADDVDTGKTLELNAGNNWTDTFTDLDEYQNGRKVTYTVEEEDVTGYIGMVSGDAETGYTITNTHEPEKTEITGSKTWDDNDDQDGVRPGEITIRLLKDGAEIDSRTVGEADDWSWTFTDLPKYENGGTEITYSITEDAVSDYTPEYDGYNVTNRHTPGKTSVSVSKVWNDADDQDGIRPLTITVKLLADDVDTGKTLELNAGNNWTDTFTDLDEYQNGQKVIYKVEEVNITGYTSIVSGDAETGYTITNTHEPEKTEITGSKTWDDNDDQDGVRPGEITIRLLKDGAEIDSRTVGEAENWSWTFTDLPKYENGGNEITYSITEDAVSDYTPEYDGYNVTNRHTPGKTSVSVSKVWNDADDQDGIRPLTITVKLLADDVDTGKTLELNAGNNWTDTFTDLDEYQNGQKVIYKVEEVNINGYTSIVSGDAETGYTITNTHEPEKTEITGSKTWDDNDDQDGVRPGEITIRLFKDGAEIDSRTVGEADDWSWTFTDLPKYENGGTEITYSITEDAVSDYTPEYDGYNVTNRHTPGKTSVSVSKVWDDHDNKENSRPKSVTIRLLADGVDTGKKLTLDADNKWTGSFTELEEYKAGKKIDYTVSEDEVKGYTTKIKGDATSGFTVTNTKTPTPPESPKTGDNSKTELYFWMMLISGVIMILLSAPILTSKRRKHRNR